MSLSTKLCYLFGYFLVQEPLTQEEMTEKEEALTDEPVVDLQRFVPVGGVYHIDLLQLPPRVSQLKGWSMVEVSEDRAYTLCRPLPCQPCRAVPQASPLYICSVHDFLSSKLKNQVFKSVFNSTWQIFGVGAGHR